MTNRIDTRLAAARVARRPALAPFITVGYPSVEASIETAKAVLDAGADVIELGVPFSDPLAEGPTIQRTSFQALQQGVSYRTCLDALRKVRAHNRDAGLILMGYYNPLLSYGLENAVRDATSAGADGFIVPDLPTEEAGQFQKVCDAHGMYLIPLLALTSTDERIAAACKPAKGFIYCVSVTGVTGARAMVSARVADLVKRIKKHTSLPVIVGFGVSSREHVQEIAKFADGAAVGSALLDAVGKAAPGKAAETAREFVRGLR